MTTVNYIPYLNKAINNDEEAFNILFTAIKPMATFYALSICKDEYTANEAVQLSAIKMYQSLNTLNDLSSFEGWFKSIVRNTVFDLLRKQGKEINFTSFDNEEDEDFEYSIADERIDYQPEKYFDQKEKERLIQEIISDLDEKQKPIIMMYFFEGLKIREIASILDIPESTVKTRLTSGKNSIKEKVEYIQTRDGIKLYNITPLSFLLFLLQSYSQGFDIRNMPAAPDLAPASTAAADLGHTGSIDIAAKGILDNTMSNTIYQNTGHTLSSTEINTALQSADALNTAGMSADAINTAATATAAAAGAVSGMSLIAKITIAAFVLIAGTFGGYTVYNRFIKEPEDSHIEISSDPSQIDNQLNNNTQQEDDSMYEAVVVQDVAPLNTDFSYGHESDSLYRYSAFAYRQLYNCAEKNENEIMSPLGVYKVLGILANGAAGNTRKEIETVTGMRTEDLNGFCYDYDPYEKYYLSANSIWLNSDLNLDLNPDFVSTINQYYGDAVHRQSFSDKKGLAESVNSWSAASSDNMITDILSEGDIKTTDPMIIFNALAMGEKWMVKFDKSDTRKENFYAYDGSVNTVDMMHQSFDGYWHDGQSEGFMKRLDNYTEFYGILPNEGIDIYDYLYTINPQTLMEYEQNNRESFNTETTSSVLGCTQEKHITNLSFPKFKFEKDYVITTSLKKMGLKNLFNP